MANKAKRKAKKDGPYLAAAFFCETFTEDKDGAISAIRMIDQYNIVLDPTAPKELPSPEQPLSIPVNAIIGFKTADCPGDHLLRLTLKSPSGKPVAIQEKNLAFSPQPQGGFNLRFHSSIPVHEDGLYWINVFLDSKLFTRMPLRISIQRIKPEAPTHTVDSSGKGVKRLRK